jgi:hypothetical protein
MDFTSNFLVVENIWQIAIFWNVGLFLQQASNDEIKEIPCQARNDGLCVV